MMKHLDPSKPADLAQLVSTGLIWGASIPVEYKDMALDALAEGRVEAPDNLPPAVLTKVNDMRNSMGMEPITTGGTPDGEQVGA